MSVPVYELYGLRIASEIPIPAPTVPSHRPADVDVRWDGTIEVPGHPPAGEVLASFRTNDGQGYAVVRTPDDYVVRYYGVADFRISHDLTQIRAHPASSTDPDFVSTLLTASVPAVLLTLAGECVLHASAVDIGGNAVAFIGPSGSGKSTITAALCARGARFVTDDLLRVDLRRTPPTCSKGPLELRLRPHAAAVGDLFPPPDLRSTWDGRRAIRFDPLPSGEFPLTALIVPRLVQQTDQATTMPLDGAQKLLELSRATRVLGWAAYEDVRNQLRRFAELCRKVPIHVAEIPWTRRFDDDFLANVRACVSSALDDAVRATRRTALAAAAR